MNVHEDRTYKAGYAKGYADAKKNEKHGRWEKCGGDLHSSGYAIFCSICHQTHFVHYKYSLGGLYGNKELFEEPKFCPNCGNPMDLPNITENTRKALEKMGENVHSEIDFDYAAEDE